MARKAKGRPKSGMAGWMAAAVVGGIAVAALGVFVVAVPDNEPPKFSTAQPSTAKSTARSPAERPWYNTQTPPPALLRTPDEPIRLILPEDANPAPGETARAYEEALPRATYSPPPMAPITLPPVIKLGAIIPPATNPPPLAMPIATWQKFAVPVSAEAGRPSIAIVIDDAGIDHKRTARAIALPAPLTIAFLTYASDLKRQTDAARRAGHELMVHVAMEPTNKDVDPGPRPLLTSLAERELLSRLDWVLSRFSGYAGINNHMGSRFTQDPLAMRTILTELKRRGLLFLDSRTSSQTVSRGIAREIDLAFAERNVFLDHEPKREVVDGQLRALERVARQRGQAIAIGHPRDATLAALAAWIPTAAARGFHLTTVGSMVASRRGIKLAASTR